MSDTGNIVFTQASLLDLLSQIDELSSYDIGLSTNPDGTLMIEIGDSHYEVSTDNATPIAVPEQVTNQVEQINEQAYDELAADVENSYIVENGSTVEGGLVKDMIKDIAIGGLVRVGMNFLK